VPKTYDIEVSRGDTLPIEFTIKNNGTAIDVTGCTITFYMIHAQNFLGYDHDAPLSQWNGGSNTTVVGIGGLKVNGAAVTLTTPASGIVTVTPESDWFDTPGEYLYQFHVVYGDGTIESVPTLLEEPLPRLRVGPGLSSLT
jgi:hypothetical protein